MVPTNPTHDDNGNATTWNIRPPSSGILASASFYWDINNQLVAATDNNTGDSAAYQYDALGRRTKRTETLGGVATETWFFSNGWNVELERNAINLTKRMTWGLDLSQSLQGAGGVGGLVMVEDLTSVIPAAYFPTYDGNGNITAWVNASGTVVARQRYDAFGNIIAQTGTAPSNYGFSTKPMDQVTGLLYYGYRFYDPETGRWPSRDPIEEEGGINLYGFVGNDGVNKIDMLGKAQLPPGLGKFWFLQGGIGVIAGLADFYFVEKACDRLRDRMEKEPDARCGDGTTLSVSLMHDRFTGLALGPVMNAINDQHVIKVTTFWLDECCKCVWESKWEFANGGGFNGA
ncbi:MAG: RHS repeat-associated core domain-containing protein [Akkermansiaceae bacterium]|jgi:RHS repeat-associated protein